MTYKGILNGRFIELVEEPPYPPGAAVEVSINAPEDLPIGSPALIRQLMKMPPFPDAETIAEFERAIEEGKLPVVDWSKEGETT